MTFIATLAGSPSHPSKSTILLDYARQRLEYSQVVTSGIVVRELPPEDLVFGRIQSPAIQAAHAVINHAEGLIVGTPIYKAAYSGLLKTFLDLLPSNALSGKIVLPIATGGTTNHLLALDYTLKPVLFALGATHILPGVFVADSQVQLTDGVRIELDEAIKERLDDSLEEMARSFRSFESRSRMLFR